VSADQGVLVSTHDRDLVAACGVVLLGLGVLWLSMALPMRGDFIESPAIFPGLMSVIVLLLGGAYAARSLARGGRIRPVAIARAVVPLATSTENRSLLLGMLFPAIYVFVAIPLVGFYISSAAFMAVMFYAYVKRWRRWVFLPVSLAITACLYLIFDRLFQLQIW
jgi:hypothetical protein